MQIPIVPMCLSCKHFNYSNKYANTCKAFPEGVPDDIFDSKFDHRKPFAGDNGVVFSPVAKPTFDFAVFDTKEGI